MTDIDIYYEDGFSTHCVFKETGAEIFTDAPKDNHGKGERFSPTDLVAAALGSCVLTVMGIYAQRHQLDISGIRLIISKEMQQAPLRKIGKLKVVVSCPRTFPSDVTARFEKVAMTCPVHQSLHPDVIQEFTFNWG